jgi:hypothetical protein
MSETNIEELTIENILILNVEDYDGFDIRFKIENQTYQFLVGNTKNPFPLNVKHVFKEKEECHLCHKLIYPAPFGQQVCKAFQGNMKTLLSYFQLNFPAHFASKR